ncbi:hypothetical protein PHAVU_011G003700 [Phaseolus vulgaris]|uniref:Uncharacterized protein n=1 Tax=Phaseolus vulgaris TaxID=3885 RepID=V7ACX9_PHAVU|nr:hypothetical protein PHAVU_011G003700g [Phaseolus vulgaris]ESW03314.1 hypothetical protein PHAVU_011G003700g [Phaseolus vulgaris]
MANQMTDPYNFLFDHAHISSSQESLLRDLSLGEHSPHSSSDSAPHSNAIVTVSPPASQNPAPVTVSHTPPRNTPIPAFCDQPGVATEGDVSARTSRFVDFCKRSKAVGLGMGSGLGHSGVQLTREMDVDKPSRGARKDVSGGIRVGRFDLTVESPLKRPNLGIGSSRGSVRVQSQKGKERVGNLVSETEKVSNENICSAGNLSTLVGNSGLCESQNVACSGERSKSSLEDSGKKKQSDKESVLPAGLPPSTSGPSKNAEESGKCKVKINVFDVLKFLAECSNEKDDVLDEMSLLEVAQACGIEFPRPRWWPEGFEDFLV